MSKDKDKKDKKDQRESDRAKKYFGWGPGDVKVEFPKKDKKK